MPDDPAPARSLRVSVTDETGRPLRAASLGSWLQRVAPARTRGEVTVALVGDRTMRRLNRRFAGVDAVTDVLSFPSGSPRGTWPRSRRLARRRGATGSPLGDIVIATGVARRQARVAGHPYRHELRLLALHGLLHLLGYDHHADNGTMARVEARLRRKGGLREGLIERARQA
jgi:probable rRNA maturation factor